MKYWMVIVAVSVWPFSPRLLFHALGTHMTAAVLNNTPALLWRIDCITVDQSTDVSWGAELN